MKIKIALCQVNSVSGNTELNFRKIEKVLKKHLKKNVKLFIFPEDFLFGVLRSKTELINAGKDFEFWKERFSKLAKSYKIDIVPGSFPKFENGKIFNTTIYINSEGKVLNEYKKTNLWLSEREDYSINPSPPKVFESILGKTMQIICWDLMDHRLFEEAVKQNTEWIINTSLWSVNQSKSLKLKRGFPKNKYKISIRRSERLCSIIETRSSEYNIGIIFCNIGGIHKYVANDGLEDEARSVGSTQILSPLDGIRKIVKNRKEQVLICDIPDIKDYISDGEIFWGRRNDVKCGYPYSNLKIEKQLKMVQQ